MTEYETSHELQVALQPPYLRRPWGERWGTADGVLKTALGELATDATKCGIVTEAPADALMWLGLERDIERGPGESVDSYRARLQNAWNDWQKAGCDAGVIGALEVLGLHPAIKRDRQWWHDNNVPGTIWARMWVILVDPPWGLIEDYTALAAKYATYGDWGAAGVGFGVEAPLVEIERIRRVIHKWTSSHVLVVNTIVIARGRVFGFPEAATYSALPAGTYDSYVAYWDGF